MFKNMAEAKFWARLTGGMAAQIAGEAGRAERNAAEEVGIPYDRGGSCGVAPSVMVGIERRIDWSAKTNAKQIRHSARQCADQRIAIPAKQIADELGDDEITLGNLEHQILRAIARAEGRE